VCVNKVYSALVFYYNHSIYFTSLTFLETSKLSVNKNTSFSLKITYNNVVINGYNLLSDCDIESKLYLEL